MIVDFFLNMLWKLEDLQQRVVKAENREKWSDHLECL